MKSKNIIAFALIMACAMIAPTSVANASNLEYSQMDTGFSSEQISLFNKYGVDYSRAEFVAEYQAEIEKINFVGRTAPLEILFNSSSRGDGCTSAPDSWGKANFRPVCDRHDSCYSRSSTKDRKTCDEEFFAGLLGVCARAYPPYQPITAAQYAGCNGVAAAYYAAVRQFGGSHYEGRGKNN